MRSLAQFFKRTVVLAAAVSTTLHCQSTVRTVGVNYKGSASIESYQSCAVHDDRPCCTDCISYR